MGRNGFMNKEDFESAYMQNFVRWQDLALLGVFLEGHGFAFSTRGMFGGSSVYHLFARLARCFLALAEHHHGLTI